MQARPLTVEEDMKPVVDFLRQKGLANKQVVNVLVQHPPVLSYDPETRLAPIVAYLEELGIEEPMEVQPPSRFRKSPSAVCAACAEHVADNARLQSSPIYQTRCKTVSVRICTVRM